jgi:hypothetical protein
VHYFGNALDCELTLVQAWEEVVALKQLRKTAKKGSTAGAGARVRQGVLVHARTPLGILNELQLAITDPAYFGDNALVFKKNFTMYRSIRLGGSKSRQRK